MYKVKFILILIIILIFFYYYDEIIDFLNTPLIWKIDYWMVGAWGIWKCSYYIWQKDDDLDPYDDQDTGREYKSLSEARYKEMRHQTFIENHGRKIEVENWTDTDGSPYFIIRVIHELGYFLFIPFKK